MSKVKWAANETHHQLCGSSTRLAQQENFGGRLALSGELQFVNSRPLWYYR
jgi:hypothetical protein